MARTAKVTQTLAQVRPYVRGVAKKLVDDIYGPKGAPWGTRLTELEELYNAIREELSANCLNLTLERQAAEVGERPPEYESCPGCRGAVTLEADGELHWMTTESGVAEWKEPETYCRKCRRSFFPSVAKSGDRPQRIQPANAGSVGVRGGPCDIV